MCCIVFSERYWCIYITPPRAQTFTLRYLIISLLRSIQLYHEIYYYLQLAIFYIHAYMLSVVAAWGRRIMSCLLGVCKLIHGNSLHDICAFYLLNETSEQAIDSTSQSIRVYVSLQLGLGNCWKRKHSRSLNRNPLRRRHQWDRRLQSRPRGQQSPKTLEYIWVVCIDDCANVYCLVKMASHKLLVQVWFN